MPQIVYILKNEGMPNLVKIGHATKQSLSKRISSLNNTSVPYNFSCYYACEVEDAVNSEIWAHRVFRDHRVNPAREFFDIDPELVKTLLEPEPVAKTDVTSTYDLQRTKAPPFTFTMVGIEPGAELSFTRDERVTATVHDAKKIMFDGEVLSLTKAALQVLEQQDGRKLSSVQGPDYWHYEDGDERYMDETLAERRDRMTEKT